MQILQPDPNCPACHGTGNIDTRDHIGLVDSFPCDLCYPPEEYDGTEPTVDNRVI